MLQKIQTNMGDIGIEKPVLAKIVREVLSQYNEIVEIVSSKKQVGSLFNKLGFDWDANYIEVKKEKKEETEMICIYFCVIMRFGSKTGAVTKKIIEEIKTTIAELADVKVDEVTIHIVGMKSKKIVPRNILIKG